jgi:hypothetical protein
MSSSRSNPEFTKSDTQIQASPPSIQLRYVPLPAPLPISDSNAVCFVVSEGMGAPCRRCLHDARPGEEVNLIAYDPFPSDSITPYRGNGPIFVHTHDCTIFKGSTIPERQLQRLLSLRAYNEKHNMVSAEVIEGGQLKTIGSAMLADEGVSYIHVHNAKPGCFAFKIERAQSIVLEDDLPD